MRKFLAVLCVMTMTLSMLTACGSAKEAENASNEAVTEDVGSNTGKQ